MKLVEDEGPVMRLMFCKICSTRSNIPSGNVCGNCLEAESQPIVNDPLVVSDPIKDDSNSEVDSTPNSHVVIKGRVYDISARDLGGCRHVAAKKLEELLGKPFYFCHICGGRMKKKVDKVKTKINTNSAKGDQNETEQLRL